MPREVWADQIIEIVENPSPKMIRSLVRRKFIGLTHRPKQQKAWAVWFQGEIVKFEGKKEEAISTLIGEIKRIRY